METARALFDAHEQELLHALWWWLDRGTIVLTNERMLCVAPQLEGVISALVSN